MAIQQEAETRPAAVRRYDQQIERQLARAGGRVRGLDLAAAALVLVSTTLLYGLVVALLDLGLGLPTNVRLAALAVYGLAALVYLGVISLLVVNRRVNPYYAALQLEKCLPDAKGSVINWLDLHNQPLPPAIQASLGARAARDVGRADVEEAIPGRRNLWLTAMTAALAVGLVVLFLTGPGRFGSLLARTFTPFAERAIPTRTDILLLQPEGGNVTVPLNQKVAFRVQVQGRVPAVNQPDAPRLLFRYSPNDPYAERPLEQDPVTDEWTTTLLADQVQSGVQYKVTAGDAQTPTYQVTVRSVPQVVRCEVRYHYRPYLHLQDRRDSFPNERTVFPHLKDYRGTMVTLTLKANRALRQGGLELDCNGQRQEIAGEIKPDAPDTLHCRFVLEHTGNFQVHFLSRDGEINSDRSSYPIDVIVDQAPLVELRQPGKDVELPSNGTLQLEGSAVDDLGIKGMTLRLRVKTPPGHAPLQAKVYRPGKSFQLADGRYPVLVGYKDFVLLDDLKTAQGKAFAAAAGMELEYWLEAVDCCDYPDPAGNVGQSKKYRVTIGPAEKDKKKVEQERAQARKDQQRHEQDQDRQLDRLNQDIKDKQGEPKKQDSPEQQAKNEQQKQDFEKKLDQVQKQLHEEQKPRPGEAKGADEPQRGSAKDKGPGQPGASKEAGKPAPQAAPPAASEKKDRGARREGAEQGQAKDAGQPGEQQPPPTQGKAKGPGEQQPQAQARGSEAGQQRAQAAAKQQGPERPGAEPKAALKKDDRQGGQRPDQARSRPKDAGQSQAREPAHPAQAKGQEPAPSQGTCKQCQGGSQSAGARAKQGGTPGQEGSAQAQAKQGPGAAQVARARDSGDQPAGMDRVASLRDALKRGQQQRQASQNELSRLKKEGQAGAPGAQRLKQQLRRQEQQRNDTLKELSRLQMEASDPAVREAARQALQQDREAQAQLAQHQGGEDQPGHKNQGDHAPAGQEKGGSGTRTDSATATGQNNPDGQTPALKDIAKLAEQVRRGERALEAAREELSRPKNDAREPQEPSDDAAEQLRQAMQQRQRALDQLSRLRREGGDPKVRQAAEQALNQLFDEQMRRTSDPHEEQPPGSPVNPAFSKRAGGLYLDELKKKLTPDMLRKLNWSAQDRERFLKEAQAYQERLQRQGQSGSPDKLSGAGKSLLPSSGPRQVGPGANRLNDPLDSLHVQPPPEFRDSYRRFTSSPPR
jgi:hypothetical protein